MIFHDRYLLLIAALVVLLNIVNTSGEFLLSKLVASEAARACEVSVVVFDHDLIPGRWRDMLRHLQERANPAALIVTSRLADDRLWAEALNLGAWDVLAKPFDRCEVTRSIERAFQHWQLSAERTALAYYPKANSPC